VEWPLDTSPRELLAAAAIALVVAVVVFELLEALDRMAMARYDATKLGEEVETYLEQRTETDDGDGG
jgi:ABC-type enterochelin transport system permease subunit